MADRRVTIWYDAEGDFLEVTFDPFCDVPSLVRQITGRTNTYYLYRIRDERGEHPLLTDRQLDPSTFHPRPGVSYEYLGKYTGQCDATAAWRKALRETRAPQTAP